MKVAVNGFYRIFKKQGVAKERVLLVGDAAGLVDPLLGEGIYYALYSGRCAGETIALHFKSKENIAYQYQTRIDQEIGQDLTIAEKLASLIYRFPSLRFRLFREYPEIFYQFCRVLAGTQNYRGFITQLQSDLLSKKPLFTRFILGTNRIPALLSTD